jgi:hypothetical protein
VHFVVFFLTVNINYIYSAHRTNYYLVSNHVDLGGLVVSVLATGPKVRGFNPGRGRWIFKGMNRTSNARRQNSAAISHPKSPDCLPDVSGSHIRIE